MEYNMKVVNISDKALKHIKNLLENEKQEGKEIGLRIGVNSGGCSGLSYKMEFGEKAEEEISYDFDSVKIFVAPKVTPYLFGITLDFQDGLSGRGFVFQNPNATSTCSCGESFSVK